MTGLRLPVFLEGWQLECCGTPPAVGDRVDWALTFHRPEDDDRDAAAAVRLDAVATPWSADPGDGGHWPTRLDAGALHVFWLAPAPVRGPTTVTGALVEDHHGAVPDRFPPTTGTVARVRVRTRRYEPVPGRPRTYGPSTDPPRYRDVDRAPGWFSGPAGGEGPYDAEDGVLVDLVVTGPGGA